MKKFLFIDDHGVVRSSFARILSEPYKPVEVEEAANGTEAIEKILAQTFDLVVLDVQMPDTDTLGLVEFIRLHSPSTKILILSMASETVHGKRYLKAGANGYVSKQAPLDVVDKAIEMVLEGRNYISETLADSLVWESLGQKGIDNPFQLLSPREYEIMGMILLGRTIGEISATLHVAYSTVSTYKARIFEKLRVDNLIQLKDLASAYKI